MNVKFEDIEYASLFASSDGGFLNSALLDTESGQIYYISDMGDSYELPEDIYESDKYINIPNQKELGLGRNLVFEFISANAPNELDNVQSIFNKKGAYSKYKILLEKIGFLEMWYEFENQKTISALQEWCKENNIKI